MKPILCDGIMFHQRATHTRYILRTQTAWRPKCITSSVQEAAKTCFVVAEAPFYSSFFFKQFARFSTGQTPET